MRSPTTEHYSQHPNQADQQSPTPGAGKQPVDQRAAQDIARGHTQHRHCHHRQHLIRRVVPLDFEIAEKPGGNHIPGKNAKKALRVEWQERAVA